jgi:methyl-accepting chemotaxis protein
VSVILSYPGADIETIIKGIFIGSNDFERAVQKIDIAIDEFNTSLGDLEFVSVIETRTEVQYMSTIVQNVASTAREMSRKIDGMGRYGTHDFFMEANIKAIKYAK